MLTFLKTKSKAVNKITLPDRIKGMFLAAAVGDALGVPYEFLDRSLMTRHPATKLTGGGTWNQPVGTWSDDTALSLCTASSLLKNGFNLSAMADLFVKWKNNQSEFTAGEKVFDIGNTTRKALDLFEKNRNLFTCGQDDDNSNGNGSLMRMPPVAVFLLYSPIRETYPITSEISAITHAHYYSTFSCFIYVEVLKSVFKEKGSKLERFKKAQTKILQFYHDHLIKKTSFEVFRTVLSTRIEKLDESQIKSTGFVIDTLEAAIWCFLKSSSVKECLLRAVNLGGDTDTIASLAGALAGAYYGSEAIPNEWTEALLKKEMIINQAVSMARNNAMEVVR